MALFFNVTFWVGSNPAFAETKDPVASRSFPRRCVLMIRGRPAGDSRDRLGDHLIALREGEADERPRGTLGVVHKRRDRDRHDAGLERQPLAQRRRVRLTERRPVDVEEVGGRRG